jgi:integrase
MKRSENRMKDGIQKRGKSSYRIAVWYMDQATGKKRLYTETVTGTEENARARKLEIEAEKLQDQFVPPDRMPLGEFLDRWLSIEGQKKSPKTYQGYESICRVHLKPMLGDVPVAKLNEFLIEGVYSSLLGQAGRKDNKKGSLSPLTIRNIHRCLSMALAVAVRWKIRKNNPCDSVTLPEVEMDEVEVWNDQEVLEIIETAEDTALPVPLAVGYYAGIRRGELLGLKWLDLEVDSDWTEAAIWVRRSVSEVDGKRVPATMLERYGDAVIPLPNTTRVLRIKQTKTRRIRKIPLPADLIANLREHFAAQGRVREKLGMSAVDLDEWMFPKPGAPGQLWAPTAFTSCYRAFLRRRSLKPARFHGLRHAYGSQLVQDGFDLKTVQALMGHSRASTTLNVYAHLFEQPGQEVARRIQARIEKVKAGAPKPQVGMSANRFNAAD